MSGDPALHPTLTQLVAVRSRLAEGVLSYYDRLLDRLDKTPWFHGSTPIPAREIAVPSRVYRRESDAEKARRSAERDGTFSDVDPALAAVYEEAPQGGQVVAWRQEQRRVRRAVIKGGPGSGKSMLAALTALEAAQTAHDDLDARRVAVEETPAVVHLKLPDLAQPGLPEDLPAAITQLLQRPYYGGVPADVASWLVARLARRDGLLLLDGLDEVSTGHHDRLKKRLAQVETSAWHGRVYLTCRPANYDRGLILWPMLSEIELAPLRYPQDVRELVRKWFGSGAPRSSELLRLLQRNFSLRHAARSPLLLSLACMAHEASPLSAGARRADLYGLVLRALLRRVWKDDPSPPNDLHIDDLMGLLEEVAWTLFAKQSEVNQFSNLAVVAAIRAAPSRPLPRELQKMGYTPEVLAQVPELLRDELRASTVLVDAGRDRRGAAQLSFGHRTFLEYLAACVLARRAEAGELPAVWAQVEASLWTPGWQEVIAFLGGTLENPMPLVDALLSCGDRDPFHHRHLLVARVLGEADSLYNESSPARSVADYLLPLLLVGRWDERARIARGLAPLSRLVLPALTTSLADPNDDEEVHRAAAQALGILGDAVALQALLSALSDPNRYVRRVATEALGELGDAAALPTLTATLVDPNTPVSVRRAAVQALGELGDAAALPTLTSVLDNPNTPEDVRRDVTQALGALGDLATLTAALSDPDGDEEWRRVAAEVLGKLGDPAAREALTDVLDDPNTPEVVRRDAVWALKKLGDVAARQALTDVLANPAPLSRAVTDALRTLGGPVGLPALIGLLADSVIPVPLRMAAAWVLGIPGDATARQALTDVLADIATPVPVRMAAIWALKAVGDPVALPTLTTILADPAMPTSVRRAATDTLRALGERAHFRQVTTQLLEVWPKLGVEARQRLYPFLLRLAWLHRSVEPLQPMAQEATDLMRSRA